MDIATLIGLIGSFAMMIMSVFASGGSLGTYADLPSFLMVVVGSIFALICATNFSEGLGVFKILGKAFNVPSYGQQGLVKKLISFSDKARREGLLALEEELEDLDDEFLKKGLRLVVDGTDAAIIRDLLEIELSQMQGRHADKIGTVSMWATLAPGYGMLGTVVGLIAMMKNLEDKASVGPNMAIALITTLYGSILANVICIPIISKLKGQDSTESQVREMVIEGILSIQAGDNPRTLSMKMLAYLAPGDRKVLESEMKD